MSADDLEIARNRIEKRFRYADSSHPVMKLLFEEGVRQEAERIARGQDVAEAPVPQCGSRSGKTIDAVDLLRKEIRLPSLPQVVVELQQLVDSPDSSAEDMARVISRDAALAAFLLRLVNSAFYNFPSRIDTISRAVTVVGTKQLCSLAMGRSIMGAFGEVPPEILDITMFWKHSVACALLARELGAQLSGADKEHYFVAGLLHDLGRLAIFSAYPSLARDVLAEAAAKGRLLHEAERDVLGFDHAKFGGMLVRKWNLPFGLVMDVLHHHEPSHSKEPGPVVVHLADIAANALGYGACPCFLVPDLDQPALAATNLDRAAMAKALAVLKQELEEMFEILT